jgi:RNA polymerase sigma factor (sigma-70 family)
VSDSIDRCQIVLGLFEQNFEALYAHARKFVAANEAEDICQVVFTCLLHSEEELQGLELGTLLAMVRHQIHARYRHTRRIYCALRQHAMDDGFQKKHHANGRASPTVLHRLEQEVARLPRDEQQALRLVICEGRSYESASHRMRVPITTIRKWENRALQRLNRTSEWMST